MLCLLDIQAPKQLQRALSWNGVGSTAANTRLSSLLKHWLRVQQYVSSCSPGTTTLRAASTRQDAKPVETVYQSFYGNTRQHQAVIVRSDGSATAQYPSEGVAVSVDPEQTGKLRTLAWQAETVLYLARVMTVFAWQA